ncbi:putative sterigmatocystin 8-O-methyltransferase precursor [Xylariomycetidae sp. FL2044]|nr:putative sterigmatocystin 8-O-methyltransferase precursor [Xylariomycetidae sp. FL2044]
MGSKASEAQALLQQIETFIGNPLAASEISDDIRRRLREAGRKLSVSMEAEGDTIHRINSVPLQLFMARVGVEKGVFDIMSQASDSSFTHQELADRTGIDPVLMKRLLRYYQSFEMISQPATDGYGANNVTMALSSHAGRHGVSYFADMISPTFTALPKFFREKGYANPTDPGSCPWHIGHQTDLSPFPWLQKNPQHFENFLPWMSSQRNGLPIFLDVLDVQELFTRDTSASTPLFVDVGGAMGHQCIAFRRKFPDVPGRVVLQDIPPVIEAIKASPLPGFNGIEYETHDFFKPQPIKGARAYYMRNVLHDWPDEKCKQILQNLKIAMMPESVILIDEMVLSERGAPWRATQLDITMLTCLAAMERTEAEWRALLDDAGFKILKVEKYTDECEDCIIFAVPK